MLLPQEFAAAWGEDRFLFPPHLLRGVDIPEASKRFLVEGGLPLWAEVPLGFYVIPLPLMLISLPTQEDKYPLLARYQSTKFRLLADLHYDNYTSKAEAGLYYAIQENTGHIYRIEPNYIIEEGTSHAYQAQPEVRGNLGRFLNTSLSHFAEFLLHYREFIAHFRPTEPEWSQVPILVDSLKKKWQEVDSLAMTSSDNCWPRDVADLQIQL